MCSSTFARDTFPKDPPGTPLSSGSIMGWCCTSTMPARDSSGAGSGVVPALGGQQGTAPFRLVVFGERSGCIWHSSEQTPSALYLGPFVSRPQFD